MSTFEARSFLDSVHGYTSAAAAGPVPSYNRSTKLGIVDPTYVAGLVRVLFDGETVMSEKGYSWVSNYFPQAGDRVMLVPAGQSYIITGKIEQHTPFPPSFLIDLHPAFTAFNDVHEAPSYVVTEESVVSFAGTYKPSGAVQEKGGANGWTIIGSIPTKYAPWKNIAVMTMQNDTYNVMSVDANGLITALNVGATWNTLSNVSFNMNPKVKWEKIPLVSPWSVYATPTYTKDNVGRVWLSGTAVSSTNPKGPSPMGTLPVGYRPEYEQYAPAYTSLANNYSYRSVTKAGVITYRGSAADWANPYLGLGQSPHLEAGVTTGWYGATMQNGWQPYGGTLYSPPSFRKDYDGLVMLRGLIKNGTLGAAAFTLPPDMRPAKQIVFNTLSDAGGTARVDILADGSVIPRSGATAWISLDNINFGARKIGVNA